VLLASDAVGDVIEHWGFRKALGRVWTTLYLSADPLTAADLADRLQMSAGSVSTTLTELQRWGVARRVGRPGERREFFEAETDFWKMISRVVRERERELATSVRDRLLHASGLLERAAKSRELRETQARTRTLLSFASIAVAVIDSFVESQTADFSEFGNLLKLVSPRGRKS
jgi:DNA-binding transcriptional regulator GbsR (MarR family)